VDNAVNFRSGFSLVIIKKVQCQWQNLQMINADNHSTSVLCTAFAMD